MPTKRCMEEVIVSVPETKVFDSEAEVLAGLAAALIEKMEGACRDQRYFRLMLGGGKTQEKLNNYIVNQGYGLDFWDSMVVCFSDERCVQVTSARSNYGMIWRTLGAPLGLTRDQFVGIPVRRGQHEAAMEYDLTLRRLQDLGRGGTLVDLALLGLGEDGHTASLFPYSKSVKEGSALAVMAGEGPEGLPRVTVTYSALSLAGEVWMMGVGHRKRAAVQKILHGPDDCDACPARGVFGARRREVLWMDRAAAAQDN